MYLGQLLQSISKEYKNIYIRGIAFDSRKVKKGDIFFAIKGSKTSGVQFINEAIINGASVIISSESAKIISYKKPIILVKNIRKSLSEACSKFYKQKPKNIIAVTGTNGKSSVADFFYQILNFNNISVASIGTLGIYSKNYNKKTNLTSMNPLLLHQHLEALSKKKIKNVILEASSHGLDQKRLDYINLKVGIFTNLSHDHLDYHKNMKLYLNSKMYLFRKLLNKNSKIITDENNLEFKTIKKISEKKNIKRFTIGSDSGDLRIISTKYKKNNQIVKIFSKTKIYNLKIPLIGHFQLKNLFMAILAASLCGLKERIIFNQLHKIKPVPGRLECVAAIKNSNIIVDFAHTPDALEQSLVALKEQFKSEIIIVFGCGGERDKKKRFSMGKIASKYCRKIFITDDNPRSESPELIRDSIMKGCKSLAVDIGDRKKAIKAAIKELRQNEILLVAGKGHEQTQDYGSKIKNFSDKKIIKEIIFNKKFNNKKDFSSNYLFQKTFKSNNIKNLNYNGVSTNSKTLKKNDLFFAIQGKNTDGHKFSKEALKRGAIKLVVSKKIKNISEKKLIKVKNTFSHLNKLAKISRNNSLAEVIGITGSVGKTTLKNLISFSLQNYGTVYHSPYSYNNRFGVPISLSNLKKNIDYGVFEIGMDKKGEIDNLSKLVKPDIAIITNISGAHFKNFKTLKDIAKAKAEIIENISKDGNIILNKSDNFFHYLSDKAKKCKINVTSFSLKKKSDVYLVSSKKIKNYFRLKINIKNKFFYFNVKHLTNNFLNNVLACITTLFVFNLNLEKVEKKFVNFKIPEGRGDIKIIKKFNKRFKFIDESYNANPLSMMSAINNMGHYDDNKTNRKLIFLGDMLELGKKSKKFHKALADIINKTSIDKVFVYGKHIKETFNYLSLDKKGKIFKKMKDASKYFAKILHNNDLLMVKGSNATGLNKFSKNIKKGQISVI